MNPRSWIVLGAIVLLVVVSLSPSLMIGRGGVRDKERVNHGWT